MKKIPASLLGKPVSGRNLRPGTLGDQLVGETRLHLLVFLRHFG